MLICAPTSSGKTNIAVLSILQTLKQYKKNDGSFETSRFKIVYIAPMKALVAEITGNLSGRFKSLNVR
jgi:pre-mRNA-splicing helicase BRR2